MSQWLFKMIIVLGRKRWDARGGGSTKVGNHKHPPIHPCTNTPDLHPHIHTHPHPYPPMHTHTHARMHTHTRMHVRTHARTHAHTHTHTHTHLALLENPVNPEDVVKHFIEQH